MSLCGFDLGDCLLKEASTSSSAEKTLEELWGVMNNHTQNNTTHLAQISVNDITSPHREYCGNGCGLLWLGDGVWAVAACDV